MIIYVLGIIKKQKDILLLLRKNSKFFSDYYSLVGGKVDPNESMTIALSREIREEIGISVTSNDLSFVHCLSCKNESGVEFIIIVFRIDGWQGSITNCELEKHAEIQWFAYDQLPKNIIPRHKQIIDMVQKNIVYSEDGWNLYGNF